MLNAVRCAEARTVCVSVTWHIKELSQMGVGDALVPTANDQRLLAIA